MNYYYLAASLPTPAFDAPPPMAPAAFAGLCRRHLRPADAASLGELLDGDLSAPSGRPFVREWRRLEHALRCAVAAARAARLKRELPDDVRAVRPLDAGMARAVADAFAQPTPEGRERELDRYRWNAAGRLAGLNPFAPAALYAYALKLRLADRWARMDADAGLRRAQAAVAAGPAAAGHDRQEAA